MDLEALYEGQKHGLDVLEWFHAAFGPAECNGTFRGCDDGHGQLSCRVRSIPPAPQSSVRSSVQVRKMVPA